MSFLALAGGVGGARMAAGLADALDHRGLSVAVNTGDDFAHLGLRVCPDLDTVMYTLAGLHDPQQGWGLAGETWAFMAAMQRLGGDTWFRLGDTDLATHVLRTRELAAGRTLSEVTAMLCRRLGVRVAVVPMSDQRVATMVDTNEGELAFQDYFVRRRCEPVLRGLRFDGAQLAQPSPALAAALADPALQAIVIGPSNPFLSIAPMLAIAPLRQGLASRRVPCVAVSPIIGGDAVKGPLAKILRERGAAPSPIAVARAYDGLIDGLVIDRADAALAPHLEAMGIAACVTDTLMRDDAVRRALAETTLAFATGLRTAR
jgi:LPPG:FO 2-phospho-L-lactate transferase